MVLDAFRARLGSIIGGFDAAQSHRRMRGFRATRAHVNTLIAASGETITARARWLVRNNGYAANAVDAFANHVVGDGIKPSSRIADAAKKEEVQKLWLDWTDEADAEGLTDFFGLQRRAAREVFLAGEVFLRIRTRRPEDGLTVPLQLQMLPSEMLPQDMTRVLPGAGSIRQGIEFDGIGRRVAYHFLRRHPGDMTDPGLAGETVRVPASFRWLRKQTAYDQAQQNRQRTGDRQAECSSLRSRARSRFLLAQALPAQRFFPVSHSDSQDGHKQ